MNEEKKILPNDEDNALEKKFIAIFNASEYKLYTLVLHLTKSDQYAKDILQEVFLSLWDQRYNLSAINNPEAWLYRVTENKVIDFLRKAAVNERLKKVLLQNLQEIITNEAVVMIETKECELIIRKAIDSLPPKRRLIYTLHREKGLSYQEIADELRVSRHTVKNQLFTALRSVRNFLARHTGFFSFFC